MLLFFADNDYFPARYSLSRISCRRGSAYMLVKFLKLSVLSSSSATDKSSGGINSVIFFDGGFVVSMGQEATYVI